MRTDDGSWTLVDPETQVAFHSGCGAVAETDHVYVNNGGIYERLKAHPEFAVLEFGLGTGLGLIRTIDAFRKFTVSNPEEVDNVRLRYVAIDRDWLDANILESLAHQPADLSDDFIAQRRRWDTEASSPVCWEPIRGVSVELWIDEANDAIQEIGRSGTTFDAVYYDAFDPESNEDAWTAGVIRNIVPLMKRDARLVTYCINRKVKELFRECGLEPTAVPGPPGGKREVMVARLVKQAQT
ncbi:MAG: MnmC family methyltransferase [Planctomycetota bacterium]